MSRALVVVDVQNDFCEGGSLPVTGGAAVAAEVSAHIRAGGYDHVVATRDHHVDPGAHFATEPDYVDTWPVHCRAGTPGASFHPDLDVAGIEAVFDKGAYAAAYSGFEGAEPRGAALAEWLTGRGVTAVDVVGIATDHCVRATALDAARAGFATTVLLHLCAGVAPDTTGRALAELRAAGVTVRSPARSSPFQSAERTQAGSLREVPTAQLPGVGELLDAAVTAVGGARREGQHTMAQAVGSAIATGEHVAVQAGTGTGKSLAYLVPAIHHAIAKDTTVVVSTATIALQRQLVDRDLPRLVKALRPLLGRTPTFAILKGRRNYLCLNKLHGGDESPEDELFDPFQISAMGRAVKRIHDWADTTKTGDRDELVPGVPDGTWRMVSVTARECLGVAKCPIGDECFAERARAAAGRADIVVTNHALLAIDALEGLAVLPEHDVVVVDEAHELVDRVTSVATSELTAAAVGVAARRLGKLIDQDIADRLTEAGEGLGLVLDDLRPARWETLPQPAAGALSAVLNAAGACRTALGAQRREEPRAAAARKIAEAALDEVIDTTARLLKSFEEPDPTMRFDVVWLAEVGADRHKVLHAAPLWVGGLLRERLFGRSTVVLTSATLALGGNFDALARQWGLPPSAAPASEDPVPDPDAPKWSGLDVGSPFAHARSGILYVARSLPPPGRDGLPPSYLDEIAGLVEAAGGRTLGLFSSMRAAKQATEALRERLSTPLLCQGDDATMLLVKRFAADEETSLFGTLSLWQGVDVPGPSLSCVIIDRIPFPRPDDPLVSARQRAADSRGGNGFLQVSATHAALLLAQGAGRLLRGMDDRGVVAILDPRLATARYGGFLRASLPPFWPTDDRAKVHGALRRLRGAASQ